MPDFELKDLLTALGPTASLIFAAWIFLSYLQQRYSAAYERYRALIAEYRGHTQHDRRRDSLREQILSYKRRCEQMRHATLTGILSAIFLITALICGALGTMLDGAAILKYATALCALIGLVLVMIAAVLVMLENYSLKEVIDSDLSDIPDLESAVHPTRPGRK